MPAKPVSDPALERLISGVRKFQNEVYPQRKTVYQELVREGQKPHTLFITCADSRIDPELVTQSGPGDIFVTRNIGNLVPAYGEMMGGVSAVIEYSVVALQIKQIVVCGHTDCGAMKGLLAKEKLSTMPTVGNWLRNAEAALSIVQAWNAAAGKDTLEQLIRQNVLLQTSHLKTHPSVAGAIAQGNLAVYGWVYDIAQGEVLMYEETQKQFFPLSEFEQKAASGAGR